MSIFMQAGHFEELVLNVLSQYKEGGTGRWGHINCDRINDAFIFSSEGKDLSRFCNKAIQGDFLGTDSFFSDLEYPLNEETFKILESNCSNESFPSELNLKFVYRMLLDEQAKHRQNHAALLKERIDNHFTQILNSISDAKKLLDKKIKNLELETLIDSNDPRRTEKLKSEKRQIRLEKLATVRDTRKIVDTLEERVKAEQTKYLALKPDQYPSISVYRNYMHASSLYKEAVTNLNTLGKNPSVHHHQGIGKIINYILDAIGFRIRTNTSNVIDEACNKLRKGKRI